MPTGSAMTKPMRMASSPSSAVTGSRPSMRSSIRQPPISDSPRVPRRRMPPIQRPYCTWIGRSRPSRRSMAARSTWPPPIAAIRPAMTSMTSPGMKRTDRNTKHAQNEQRGDDQQQPPDDVGSHNAVTATKPLPPWVVRGADRLIQSLKGRVDSWQSRLARATRCRRRDSEGTAFDGFLRIRFLVSDPGRSRGGRGRFAHRRLCSRFHR